MANICVIGLGIIGFPLALLLAKANHRVVGVDKNQLTLKNIYNNSHNEPNGGIAKSLLEKYLNSRLFVTEDLQSALSESEVVIVAIGTGVGSDGSPDLSSLFGLVEEICSEPETVKGKLFIFKSTLPVGTTRKIAKIIEEKTEMKCGDDFYVAFCPERVLGDKAITEMESLPKIIGGMDTASSHKTESIIATIGGKIIFVDTPESAELIKLMDNSYRQTLFAFANDFALICELQGINAYDLIRAANDSYPRNNIPMPSAGVSGYCLSKDPLYLETSFKEITSERGFPSVWFMARKSNDYMPTHVLDLLKKKFESLGKRLKGKNVLVCGIAYKENTDDIRNSHGLKIANKLQRDGANVFLWDPQVQNPDLDFEIINDPNDVIEILDALIFTIKHDEFVHLGASNNIFRMVNKMRTPVVIDGWGLFPYLALQKGVHYAGVGIGK